MSQPGSRVQSSTLVPAMPGCHAGHPVELTSSEFQHHPFGSLCGELQKCSTGFPAISAQDLSGYLRVNPAQLCGISPSPGRSWWMSPAVTPASFTSVSAVPLPHGWIHGLLQVTSGQFSGESSQYLSSFPTKAAPAGSLPANLIGTSTQYPAN